MDDLKRLNEQRMAEKRGEFLLEATLRMSERKEAVAMSLLLAAIDVYGANYDAVRCTLENWKANGQLPNFFNTPNSIEDFREMCCKVYGIDSRRKSV